MRTNLSIETISARLSQLALRMIESTRPETFISTKGISGRQIRESLDRYDVITYFGISDRLADIAVFSETGPGSISDQFGIEKPIFTAATGHKN